MVTKLIVLKYVWSHTFVSAINQVNGKTLPTLHHAFYVSYLFIENSLTAQVESFRIFSALLAAGLQPTSARMQPRSETLLLMSTLPERTLLKSDWLLTSLILLCFR